MKKVDKPQDRKPRKIYKTPKVTTYGDVAKLTRGPVTDGLPSNIIILRG